jgi:hypothetical protein
MHNLSIPLLMCICSVAGKSFETVAISLIVALSIHTPNMCSLCFQIQLPTRPMASFIRNVESQYVAVSDLLQRSKTYDRRIRIRTGVNQATANINARF